MKFRNIALCFIILIIIFIMNGCDSNVNNNNVQNVIEESVQSENSNYSKYIGSYSIISDEGTQYESKQVLTIKSIDGVILDFEYELQPYRHTVTITANQGVFSSETTAEAIGTYNIDGQVMPYGFEFKFNYDSIDLKCGFPDELNETDYVTFYLQSKNNSIDNTDSTDAPKTSRCDNSTGIDNTYTEPHQKGTGRQFTMTIDEFIEKYNQKLLNREEAKIETDKEEYTTKFYGREIGWYSYLLNMEKAAIKKEEEITLYTFRNVSKLDGETQAHLCVLCYEDTNKICGVYCQVSESWYQNDSEQWTRKIKQPQSRDDYVNIPFYFDSFAYDVFSCINPELDNESDDIHTIIDKAGSNNINYIDSVNYYYYDSTSVEGEMMHGLLMFAGEKGNNILFKATIN